MTIRKSHRETHYSHPKWYGQYTIEVGEEEDSNKKVGWTLESLNTLTRYIFRWRQSGITIRFLTSFLPLHFLAVTKSILSLTHLLSFFRTLYHFTIPLFFIFIYTFLYPFHSRANTKLPRTIYPFWWKINKSREATEAGWRTEYAFVKSLHVKVLSIYVFNRSRLMHTCFTLFFVF